MRITKILIVQGHINNHFAYLTEDFQIQSNQGNSRLCYMCYTKGGALKPEYMKLQVYLRGI